MATKKRVTKKSATKKSPAPVTKGPAKTGKQRVTAKAQAPTSTVLVDPDKVDLRPKKPRGVPIDPMVRDLLADPSKGAIFDCGGKDPESKRSQLYPRMKDALKRLDGTGRWTSTIAVCNDGNLLVRLREA